MDQVDRWWLWPSPLLCPKVKEGQRSAGELTDTSYMQSTLASPNVTIYRAVDIPRPGAETEAGYACGARWSDVVAPGCTKW